MSENNNNNRSIVPLIATVVVLIAAIAAVIVLVVMSNNKPVVDNNSGSGSVSGDSSVIDSNASVQFHPTQELIDECNNNAHDLVQSNYEIVRMFLIEPLPHEDEPYGNKPEDGYYTASSSKYPNYSDMEKLVNSTFTADEAKRVLTNLDGSGLTVYNAREGYGGALGVIADFKPAAGVTVPESSRIVFVPVSETECKLSVYPGADSNTDLSGVSADKILETTMVKEADGWKLTKLVY